MHIAVVGLSHRTASVEIRERLSIAPDRLTETLQGLVAACPHVQEAAILSTCNRLEVYAVLSEIEHGLPEISQYLAQSRQAPLLPLRQHLFTLLNQDAIMHLLRVAGGLDSMILGEGQVLAQVKGTYQAAQQAKTAGRILNELFKVGLKAGKRVRTETEIGTKAVSISSAAVELAHTKMSGLKGRHNLVIGAGDMGELFLRHLIAKGADRITLLNRSIDRAERLAAQFQQQPILVLPWEKLMVAVSEADLVFTCTATQEPILARQHLEGMDRAQRALTFFDIGMPRNIAPDVVQVHGVWAYNVDDLKEVVDRNMAYRQQMVQQAEILLEDELNQFMNWWRFLEAVPIVNSLHGKLESIRLAELEKALSRLGTEFAGKHQDIIDGLTRAIVNKILHDPVLKLRAEQDVQARRQAMRALQTLFNLEN
ncbi:glutamyl-tRNA reductase [Anthocerotibacter panamensis]|uniref:glutamyl-tRNA reductase n=1 Tax=Anthocerotibacter panamensis TaxID=2857077 RepID=UPI001C4076C3|nr:glutamyl-tRNA reductase [Anthocerotibacter panamensis]